MSERAVRLGVAVLTFGVVNEPPRDALAAMFPLLHEEAVDIWRDGDDADRDIANACLLAEAELRTREWDALGTLLAAIPPGGDYWDVQYLPAPDAIPALQALGTLGWFSVEEEE
jgi:hypothetical protein